MFHLIRRLAVAALCIALPLSAEETGPVVSTELTKVVSQRLQKTTNIPGELQAFQAVDLHAKVTGFVESIHVDRGSRVKKGDVLAVMTAPEIEARRAEAEARIATVEADLREAEANLAAAESTYQRLSEASKTPGVVAGNEVVLAGKSVEANQAKAQSLQKSIVSAQAALRAVEEMLAYLHVTAPFDGVISARHAHPGSLVGPAGNDKMPLLRIEQINRLRLVAPVPEAYTQGIRTGARVQFTVPAFPGQTFSGIVARPAFSLNSETRTMPVEIDVNNSSGKLAPGMYAEIAWPVSRGDDSLFVPASAIKTTTERIFVIRVSSGKAEWVDVKRGASEGGLVEVFGDLRAGDTVVLRATDEIRSGTPVQAAP